MRASLENVSPPKSAPPRYEVLLIGFNARQVAAHRAVHFSSACSQIDLHLVSTLLQRHSVVIIFVPLPLPCKTTQKRLRCFIPQTGPFEVDWCLSPAPLSSQARVRCSRPHLAVPTNPSAPFVSHHTCPGRLVGGALRDALRKSFLTHHCRATVSTLSEPLSALFSVRNRHPLCFGSTIRSDPNRSLCGKPHPSRAARSRTCGHIAAAAPPFEPAYPHTRSTALAAFFPCATQASPFVTSVQPATTGIASFKRHPLPFKRAAPWMTHRRPHPCWRWSIRTLFGP